MNATRIFTDNKVVKKTFTVAGIGFLLVCAIGFLTSYTIDSSGVIRSALNSSDRLNFEFYSQISKSTEMAKLAKISVLGMVFIFASGILNLVWAFRWTRSSKPFIFTTLTLYIIGQGIGFGILFLTWNASDLMAIFGISGGIFGIMAIVGWTAKNLMPLGKLLIVGTIVALGFGFVSMILYFNGVYSNRINMIMWSFTGLLTIGWIAFDIWWIKSMTHNEFGLDEDMEFRIVTFFGFRLLSDLIALIWTVARFYLQTRR